MPTYKLQATVPLYLTYEVEADNLADATTAVNSDAVEFYEKYIDYDSSTLELLAVDGEPV